MPIAQPRNRTIEMRPANARSRQCILDRRPAICRVCCEYRLGYVGGLFIRRGHLRGRIRGRIRSGGIRDSVGSLRYEACRSGPARVEFAKNRPFLASAQHPQHAILHQNYRNSGIGRNSCPPHAEFLRYGSIESSVAGLITPTGIEADIRFSNGWGRLEGLSRSQLAHQARRGA